MTGSKGQNGKQVLGCVIVTQSHQQTDKLAYFRQIRENMSVYLTNTDEIQSFYKLQLHTSQTNCVRRIKQLQHWNIWKLQCECVIHVNSLILHGNNILHSLFFFQLCQLCLNDTNNMHKTFTKPDTNSTHNTVNTIYYKYNFQRM